MKPLLIIPPAPGRWPALEDLLGHKGPPWLADIERRLVRGVPGAQDAYAVMPSGGQFLGSACVNKWGDVGVLGHCYTRPEHRRRGIARTLVDTVLSWFDMMGGKWLFLGTTAELDEGLYRKFGIAPLRRVAWTPYDRLMMLRVGRGVWTDPLADVVGEVTVRDVTRAEWPAMVALLQYRCGPDPRVPLDESAVIAEPFTLDLIDHQERGACRLLGALQSGRLVGLASLAIDRSGERTYAMLMPHTDAPPQLRGAVEELARSRGYMHVDYPMEALRDGFVGAVFGTSAETFPTQSTQPPPAEEPSVGAPTPPTLPVIDMGPPAFPEEPPPVA